MSSDKEPLAAAPEEVPPLWRDSDQYQRLMRGSWGSLAGWLLLVAALCFIGVVAVHVIVSANGFADTILDGKPETPDPVKNPGVLSLLRSTQVVLVGIATILLVVVLGKYLAARRHYNDHVKQAKENNVNAALDRVYVADLALKDLFVLNRRQLDEYHSLSVRQQNEAFRNAQVASTIAFTVLVAAAMIVVISDNTLTKAVSGGLGAVGAALSSYVAATFYRSYEDTSRQLRRYYREPFRTSKVLGLQRIVNSALYGVSEPAKTAEVWKGVLAYLYEDPLTDPEECDTKSSGASNEQTGRDVRVPIKETTNSP